MSLASTLPGDETLVQRVLAGCDESFRVLMARYQTSIYRLAYYWTGNRDDAQDLTQECFIHLYRVLGRFDSRYRFPVWMYKVCTNRCINWIKANRRAREVVPFSHLSEQALELPDSSPGPAQAAFNSETRELLLETVKNLPEKYRVPIVLRYLEDFSYKEIAAIMGISVKNAEIRIHRARKMLYDLLREEFN
ncbi:MAG: RNA polymerase sigma factor [Armatimonadetes bacterium]|nr:RNA polymerase sigma factor [Armatimonadota bacterium]